MVFQILDFFADSTKRVLLLLAYEAEFGAHCFVGTSLEAATIFVELVAIHYVSHLWVVHQHKVAVDMAVVGGENGLPDS
jgi:hypothetical protein